MASPLAEALICPPEPTITSEFDVGPSLRIVTVLPVIEVFANRLISPEVLFVLSDASDMIRLISPLPAFNVFALASVMPAAPESRWASTTPFAAVSLAYKEISPPFVVMLSLTAIERPARKVMPPAFCAKPPT